MSLARMAGARAGPYPTLAAALFILWVALPYLPTDCNESASFEFRSRLVKTLEQHCKETGGCDQVFWRRAVLPPYLNIYVTGTQDDRARKEALLQAEAVNSNYKIKNCFKLKFENP